MGFDKKSVNRWISRTYWMQFQQPAPNFNTHCKMVWISWWSLIKVLLNFYYSAKFYNFYQDLRLQKSVILRDTVILPCFLDRLCGWRISSLRTTDWRFQHTECSWNHHSCCGKSAPLHIILTINLISRAFCTFSVWENGTLGIGPVVFTNIMEGEGGGNLRKIRALQGLSAKLF